VGGEENGALMDAMMSTWWWVEKLSNGSSEMGKNCSLVEG
jgi:hypothetical protein